jgi:hypothetical protein
MAVIFHVTDSESLLSSIAERLKRMTMSDWMKIGLTLAGFAIITWSMVQQHEYRFEMHLAAHDEQFKEISKTLHDIDVTLARMNVPK